MADVIKSIPNDKMDWLKMHTLTPEQRQQLITQKLELARKQFEAQAKTPVPAWGNSGQATRAATTTINSRNVGGLPDGKLVVRTLVRKMVAY